MHCETNKITILKNKVFYLGKSGFVGRLMLLYKKYFMVIGSFY